MRVFIVTLLLAWSTVCAPPGSAQTTQTAYKDNEKPHFERETERQKANENLLVLMGGGLGGPYLHLAHDIAVAVNDGDDLRVLPVASSGAFTNVRDIILLRGVDLGITTVQILNALKESGEYGKVERQIAYIAPLSVDTFHVLARPEIKTIQDLNGKKASFNTKGSGTARFGPMVLKALGVKVTEVAMAQGDAIQAMQRGQLDATLCSCPTPVPQFPKVQAGTGFRFLEVPYLPVLEKDYVPASITSAQYPNLVAKGSKVQTIATSTILVTFNWAPGTERYRKVEKFVNAFFSNIDKLRKPPRHPAWRSVNLGANIRGWKRFPAAQEWLDRQQKRLEIDGDLARAQAARASGGDKAEQERLFKEFLKWSRNQPRK